LRLALPRQLRDRPPGRPRAAEADEGDVESGLPTLTFPVLLLAVWFELAPIALAIAAVMTAEGLTVSQSAGRRNGEPLDANGELFASSLANAAGACTGSMPIGASASRTAALAATGARTQMPAVVSAVGALAAAVHGTSSSRPPTSRSSAGS
jgi:sulfate permease, SulP family